MVRVHFSPPKKAGGIAQLGERLNGIQEVSGSIPLISTRYDSGTSNVKESGSSLKTE